VAPEAARSATPKGDLKAQANQAWENVRLARAGSGATFQDVANRSIARMNRSFRTRRTPTLNHNRTVYAGGSFYAFGFQSRNPILPYLTRPPLRIGYNEVAGQKIVPAAHRNPSFFKTLQFDAECL
jgi:hypothetical protein